VRATDDLQIDTPEQITLELPLAGIGSRFLGLAIDTILQFILFLIGIFAFAVAIPSLRLERYLARIPASWGPALILLFLFCVYWGYFAFFEILWKGQTPGKRLAKIRVIKESGRPINVYEAIGRNLLRAIDWLPSFYGVGIICMMLNREHKRLGDYVAGTVVVHDRRAEEIRPDWDTKARDSVSTVPELAALTSDDLVLIETYLQRRAQLDPVVRDNTASQIASRITAKTALQRGPVESLDEFLESVAGRIRDTARFR
jgi:uncharacterized RDD family membrane protein YckC